MKGMLMLLVGVIVAGVVRSQGMEDDDGVKFCVLSASSNQMCNTTVCYKIHPDPTQTKEEKLPGCVAPEVCVWVGLDVTNPNGTHCLPIVDILRDTKYEGPVFRQYRTSVKQLRRYWESEAYMGGDFCCCAGDAENCEKRPPTSTKAPTTTPSPSPNTTISTTTSPSQAPTTMSDFPTTINITSFNMTEFNSTLDDFNTTTLSPKSFSTRADSQTASDNLAPSTTVPFSLILISTASLLIYTSL